MHIFLTGEMHMGKSTVIEKVLKNRKNLTLGGFKTVSAPVDIEGARAGVYIVPVDETGDSCEKYFDKAHLVGIRWGGTEFTAFPEMFESVGRDMLKSSEEADLIIMDEIGVMEGRSPSFTEEILKKLDSDTSILGVIKPLDFPLLNAIRSHKSSCVIEVTEDNRDTLPKKVERLLFESTAKEK